MWSDESGVGTDQDSQAGIRQSGGGLVSDGANQIILATGNGIAPTPSPGNTPPDTLSESVVRLVVGSNGQLTPTDYFSPSDAPTLDQNDEDLGSGGPMVLPSPYFGNTTYPELLVEVGKDGRIFLLNAQNLGGREQGAGGTDDTLETLGPYVGVWGHPAAFGGGGGWVYVLESSGGGNLMALSYGVNGSGVPQLTAAATSTDTFGYGSGSPIVTSNGTKASTAVVWGVYENGNAGKSGQLRAVQGDPERWLSPALVVGFDRHCFEIHHADQLRRDDLSRKPERRSHGIRGQVECAPVGLPRRLRAGAGRVDKDHGRNSHGQHLTDLYGRV